MYKRCTNCNYRWESRDAFLSDPNIVIIGYQVNFEKLQLGYFLFNHTTCQTTLAIHAADFVDLYHGPIYSERKSGTAECESHCLHRDDLGQCSAKCECSYIREIIQIVRKWSQCKDCPSDLPRVLTA